MAGLPRIITVDPTGMVARAVRSGIELLELSLIQVDVPGSTAAIEEAAKAALVVIAVDLDEQITGFDLALRIRKMHAGVAVLVLGELENPDQLDGVDASEQSFVYLSRPFDAHQFLRVLAAGLRGQDAMTAALIAPATSSRPASVLDKGVVPPLDLGAAQVIIDSLLTDLGAMAIIMATRTGDTLLERGAVGYIDRERLTRALMPIMATNIGVKELFGGQVSTVQFYDGEDYDVFVLSVGLHHFLSVLFDGQQGSRQFGLVNRFGRRAVEDLIALLGANAFFIQPAEQSSDEDMPRSRPRKPARKPAQEEDEPIVLAPAELRPAVEEKLPETPPAPKAEPIADLDPDKIFSEDIDLEEDLFDPDQLEEIAKQSQVASKSTIDWDQAVGLDILKN